MIPFPDKKYKIIYADPPWSYDSGVSPTGGIWGLAKDHYQTMNLDEIISLPINQIADDDCFLFLWCVFPQLQEALDLIKSWGFEYKTVAFTWIKKNPNGSNFIGMGWYTRANAEICLIARRGKIKVIDNSVKQIIETTYKNHSQKPSIVRNKIIQLCGDLPRIELFARTKVHGWDTWGNDEKLQLQPLESFYSEIK